MSPENDLLFAHSEFGNSMEFDNFPKDLFLSNAIEEIADGGYLGDLDCKDDLKPLLICEVDDAFGDSLKVGENDGPNSVKDRCSPFTMFIDEESSEPVGFINMPPKLDTSDVRDGGAEMESMPQSSAIKHSPPSGSSEQGALPSHQALLAASELDCMSLDELDLTRVNSTNALCTMSPLSSLRATSSVTQGNTTEMASSVTSSSPIRKAPTIQNLLRRRKAPPLSSSDMAASSILQINSLVTSPSSTATLRSSDEGSLLNMMLRGDSASSIHGLKGSSTPQLATVLGVEAIHSAFSVPNVMQSPSSSMQRSQSSHALGQLGLSGKPGPCNDEFNVLPSCKQEVSLSNAPSVSFYTPYQTANTQGFAGSCPTPPIRRVYSTGDLQALHGVQSFYGGNPDSVIAEEAPGVKIGHCTMEERKMKLHRYRQKRTERNFSKKIKYACRKTLADSRPRVRGRFARTDEMGDSSLRGSDLPLIDECEEVTNHRPRMIHGQHVYLMPNNSCILASNPIAQFLNAVGMKVAI